MRALPLATAPVSVARTAEGAVIIVIAIIGLKSRSVKTFGLRDAEAETFRIEGVKF